MDFQKPDLRPTIFLDTNGLQYLNSYLRYAEKLQLPPFANPQQYSQLKKKLRDYFPRAVANMVIHGCQTLAFLQQEVVENDAAIYTSRLAKAEILHGVLDGQAHARLAREGLPYRMRQHIRILSKLVSMYLERGDYEKLVKEIDELLMTLEEKGRIKVEFAEDRVEDFFTIAAFSEFLQSQVFLDVLDCWMYGCAIALQADQIITFDDHFRYVINSIHNPQKKQSWQQIRSSIECQIGSLFPVKTSVIPPIPKVENLPEKVPELWRENSA